MSALIQERPDDHVRFLKKQLSLSQNNALSALHDGPVKGPIKENAEECSDANTPPGRYTNENRNSPRSSPAHRAKKTVKGNVQRRENPKENWTSTIHKANNLSKEPTHKTKTVRVQNREHEHFQKSTGSQPLFHLTQSDSLDSGNINQSNNVSKSTSSVGSIKKRPLVGRPSKSYNGPRLTGNRLGFDKYPPGHLHGVGNSDQFSISGQGLDTGPSGPHGNKWEAQQKPGKFASKASPHKPETCTSPPPPRLPPLSSPVPSFTKGKGGWHFLIYSKVTYSVDSLNLEYLCNRWSDLHGGFGIGFRMENGQL